MKLCIKTAILFSLLLISNLTYAAPKPVGGIVAKVNDEIITSEQLNQQLLIIKRQLKSQRMPVPAEKELAKQIVDMMINQALQLQIAKRVGLTVTDKEINEMLQNIAKSQKITTQQLLATVRQQGLDNKEFLAQLKKQLLISKLQKEIISPQINITQAEIDTYLRSIKKQNNELLYHVEDLFIALPTSPTPAQIKKTEQYAHGLIKKLKAGKDVKFLLAAEKNGENTLQSDDLGWRSLAALPVVFASTIQTMKTGDLSQPLLSNDGFHILSLAGVRSNKNNTDPDLMRNEVTTMLLRRKFEERLAIWLQQLRDSSYIEIMP